MAAYSALLRGAPKVFVVDRVPDRLRLAEQIGAIPINFAEGRPGRADPGRQTAVKAPTRASTRSATRPPCPRARSSRRVVLNSLVETVRPTGMLGVLGLYVTRDPGAPTEEASSGKLLFKIGRLFEKGLRMGTGQCQREGYNRQLRDMIIAGGRSRASWSPTSCRWTQAPEAYAKFDASG